MASKSSMPEQTSGRSRPDNQVSSVSDVLRRTTSLSSGIIELVAQNPACSSMEDVIEHYFALWASNWETSSAVMGLFQSYPALTTASLIANDILMVPIEIRSQLVAVLRKKPDDLNFLKVPADELKGVLDQDQILKQTSAAARLLQELQALSIVVVEPANLGHLVAAGFSLPETIAYTPFDRFHDSMTRRGLAPDVIRRIHTQAVNVQCKVEESWMTMLQGDRFQEISSFSATKDTIGTVKKSDDGSAQKPTISPAETLADWFGDLDEVACEECNSVTSPAAYLVDLLRMLKVTRDSTTADLPHTLLYHFFQRRPDIGDLLLSCRNTNELVPYVDLANEVMESAIYYRNQSGVGAPKIKAFNADDHASSNHGLDSAQNTQAIVYEQYLSKKIFPSSIFPFEHGRVAVDHYVSASGYSLAELRRAFWPLFYEQSNIDSGKREADVLEATLQRAQAADVLGLSDLDYLALTDEEVWSLLVTEPGSSKPSSLKRTAVWGYEGEQAQREMLDATNGKGLPYIRKQLLPRLEINFATLCDILKSRFLNGALAVSLIPAEDNINLYPSAPTQLNGFRLAGRDGSSLDVDSCYRLAQFVRIWQRLSWSVSEVDDALSRFGVVESGVIKIVPETIEALAALHELATKAQWQPTQIVALWHSDSTYFHKFQWFQTTEFRPSLAPFLATIEMTYEDYVLVKTNQNLGDNLNRDTIFQLNRAQSLAKLFGVTLASAPRLLEILAPGKPLYSSPAALLDTWKQWQRLKSLGWSYETISSVAEDTVAASALPSSMQKQARSLICQTLNTLVQLQHNTQSELNKSTDNTQDKIQTSLARVVESGLTSILVKSNSTLLKFLLTEKLEGSTKSASTSILDSIMNASVFLEPNNPLPSTGCYIVSGETCEVAFTTEGGQQLAASIVPDVATIDVVPSASTIPVTLEKDTLTWVQYPVLPHSVKISVKAPKGTNTILTSLTQQSVATIETTIGKLNRLAIISDRNTLSALDMAMLFGSNQISWTTNTFSKACSYDQIRSNFRLIATKFDFPKFILWLQKAADETKDLAAEFAEITGIPPGLAKVLLPLASASNDSKTIKQDLSKLSTMEKTSHQIAILHHLGLGHEAVEPLSQFVRPRTKGQNQGDGDPLKDEDKRPVVLLAELIKAAQLGSGKTATVRAVEDKLRMRRRRALVAYLLQDEFFISKGITDADGLFEYFLIDVQMGACLETTRIKQAISTIQLFVQRCLLGLEPEIDSGVIDKTRWQWMQKYTLWEANRKVFLYPENWADPTLRDDKTELFKTIEAAITQTNLDEKTVSNMICSYAYGAEAVANLRIESYIWDRVEGDFESEGYFHFFARTRNQPFQHYYRRLSNVSQGGPPVPLWSAWQKVELTIRAHRKDNKDQRDFDSGTYVVPAVWRHRLFLFLPQVERSDKPKDASGPLTISQTKVGSADAYQIQTQGAPTDVSIEIKMSWAEYIEDKWTTPVQCDDIIKVEKCDDTTVFRFLVDENLLTQQNLSVYVLRSRQNKGEEIFIGRFEKQGERLIKYNNSGFDESLKLKETLGLAPNVDFGRITLALPQPPSKPGDKPVTPKKPTDNPALLLAQPRIGSQDPLGTITWILHSGLRAKMGIPKSDIEPIRPDPRPLGLVADVPIRDDVGNETWFALPEFTDPTNSNDEVYVNTIYTTFSNPMGAKLGKGTIGENGVEGIFKALDELLPPALLEDGQSKGLTSDQQRSIQRYRDAFGLFNQLLYCNERTTPSAIYNWELGFHLIAFLVERLSSLQLFDLAIKCSRFVFDPTLRAKNQNVWRFPPFRDSNTRKAGTVDTILSNLRPSSGETDQKQTAIREWEETPFAPHVVARGRPLAYMKRFVMKVVESLVASGDTYFRQQSLEAIPLAIQRYVEASHILGTGPQKVPKVTQVKFASYNDLRSKMDDFSNAAIQFQLLFPYFVPGTKPGLQTTPPSSLPGWTMTRYFCVRSNPEFSALRALVDDRLMKIRNCQDIDGKPRKLSLFDPPIDPGKAIAAAAGKPNLASLLDVFEGSLPRQRFQYLSQKAIELCNDVRQLSNSFTMAVEKRDGEKLQTMRADHDVALQSFLTEVKNKQIEEVNRGIEHLQETRKGAVMRLKFYSDLTGDTVEPPTETSDFKEIPTNIPMVSNFGPLRLDISESVEDQKADASRELSKLALADDLVAGPVSLIPMPAANIQPFGLGVSMQMPSLAEFWRIRASAYRASAGILMEESQKAGRYAQYTRQLRERRLQINLAGYEIKGIDKQIAIQNAHKQVIEHDIKAQQMQADNAVKVKEYLQFKFTREELYEWQVSSVRSSLYETYTLAMELAKKAERAYKFETGNTKQTFIRSGGYWDDGRHGLDAGEQLNLALRRMDLAHGEGGFHDYEISKDISLRQVSAEALLTLRASGKAAFKLPEALFDLDFPGHYRRRIRGVAVSIHCLAGPYTSSNATLTLTKHSQRINELTTKGYARDETSDDRFSGDDIVIPITAVAISSGQFDSGVFELDFRNINYQPFEGAGAISEWQLEMPEKYRQFDYDTISDVVLHLRYTSKAGSSTFRDAAIEGVSQHMNQTAELSKKYGLHMLISARSDYPDGWVPFAVPKTGIAVNRDATANISRQITLTKLRDHLPFFARASNLVVTGLTIYVAFSKTNPTSLRILSTRSAVSSGQEEANGALVLPAQDVTSGNPTKMVMFQWDQSTSKPDKDNMATVSALPNLLSKSPELEDVALTMVADFGRTDPGRGLQAIVLIEYHVKG